MDRFEKWVTENRAEFDAEAPSDQIWERIDQKMVKKSRNKKLLLQISAAASIVILIGISFFAGMQYSGKSVTSGEMAFAREEIEKTPKFKIEKTEYRDENKAITSPSKPFQAKAEPTENTMLAIQETDIYYRQTLLEQREEIMMLSGNNPVVINSVNEEFMTLDSTIKVLAKDLGENVNNLEVMQAIVQNYRLRIEMLNMMIQQLKENDHESKTIQL